LCSSLPNSPVDLLLFPVIILKDHIFVVKAVIMKLHKELLELKIIKTGLSGWSSMAYNFTTGHTSDGEKLRMGLHRLKRVLAKANCTTVSNVRQ
jgi:hypothetical protein